MIRTAHRWPGIAALALVVTLSLSGAALSVFPAAERLVAPQAAPGMSVAELAAGLQAAHPGIEQIRRAPSGRITAYWTDDGVAGSAVIDPVTATAVAAAAPDPLEQWLTNLHRALFLGDAGRIGAAGGAAIMLLLTLSGSLLVARRVGGWRRWFRPLRGPLPGRIHTEMARLAVPGLLLSSVTALWLAASTFGLLPDQGAPPRPIPPASGLTGAPVAEIPALVSTPVASLRRLDFPAAGDSTDVFTLKTSQGTAHVDQGTGATLGWSEGGWWAQASETVYMLHTGRGAPVLALLLGATALAVPAMGATGLAVWLAARRGKPRITGNAAAAPAETVILVGSEGGSTWGFAATLHRALTHAGQLVHVAPMSSFDPARTAAARRYLILAATYGDGAAPASADRFLDRLAGMAAAPAAPLAVLGFGDSGFPDFCGYARRVEAAARAKGWQPLLPFATVDRQSPQAFARWGSALGAALGIALELDHRPAPPATVPLTLVARREFGRDVQAPATILRFAIPRTSFAACLSGSGFARFQAGDLLGIVPAGSTVPRFYSLASGSDDGFLEIAVRRQAGGLCSGQLTTLPCGGKVDAFLRRNPQFHAGNAATPLVLVGAGTGIAPLAGFVRANTRRRAIHLFFGMRHPDSDFLYGDALTGWLADGRLATLTTASSRGASPRHVQDALAADPTAILDAVRHGGRIMVCGGRAMAAGVAEAIARLLERQGLSLAQLRTEGRYVEDVY
ncbi:MAG: PepSY domain-containing protein [Ferrovibrionaceae bacterium]